MIAVVAAAVVVGGAFLSGGGGGDDAAPPSSSGGAFPVEVTLPPISAPAILATGRLVPAAGQAGGGEVTVVRQPDSSVIVRLDRLDLPGGPGVAAYLVSAESALRPDGGTLLGRFTADRASHNLPVPGGTEPGPGATVLLWSESGQRPLASAVLGSA